jgi:streptogramin lyase
VTVRTAQVRIYPFPSSNIGLMQLAVDTRGNAWVGEMFANRFARLDSRTEVVTTWDPPDGKNGIMTTTVDAQGNVWFVEQDANYLGRFDPARQTFRTFPLGTVHGHPMGPQDPQFDTSGKLWFTEATGGQIGRLDPATGRVQTWPVPPPAAGIPSSPFSLTVLPNGQIWFGYLTGGAVGHLDAATGRVTLYHLADPGTTVFSIAHDAKGRIWFTEIVPGKLGMIDSASGRITELPVPAMSGNLLTRTEQNWEVRGTHCLLAALFSHAPFSFSILKIVSMHASVTISSKNILPHKSLSKRLVHCVALQNIIVSSCLLIRRYRFLYEMCSID